MAKDLDKLAAELEEETKSLRESSSPDADADVSPNAPMPDELKKEQADLEQQLQNPLRKLDELAGR